MEGDEQDDPKSSSAKPCRERSAAGFKERNYARISRTANRAVIGRNISRGEEPEAMRLAQSAKPGDQGGLIKAEQHGAQGERNQGRSDRETDRRARGNDIRLACSQRGSPCWKKGRFDPSKIIINRYNYAEHGNGE